MPTDPPFTVPHRAVCPDDPRSDLVALVHERTRTVIEAELRRMARRAPALCRADLDVIDAALEDLAESLILARLRSAREDTVPLLKRLLDTTKVVS